MEINKFNGVLAHQPLRTCFSGYLGRRLGVIFSESLDDAKKIDVDADLFKEAFGTRDVRAVPCDDGREVYSLYYLPSGSEVPQDTTDYVVESRGNFGNLNEKVSGVITNFRDRKIDIRTREIRVLKGRNLGYEILSIPKIKAKDVTKIVLSVSPLEEYQRVDAVFDLDGVPYLCSVHSGHILVDQERKKKLEDIARELMNTGVVKPGRFGITIRQKED